MYEGQAKIKLYEDSACTKELKIAPNGDYVVTLSVTTGHGNGEYKKNLYIKNVGTHTAYNVVVIETSDVSNKFTITQPSSAISNRNGKSKITVTTPYTQGEKVNNRLTIKISYDNIP